MKDLLLCVHIVVKTLNLEISRCHLAGYVKELYQSVCRTCSTIIYPHSINQITVFWRCRCCCLRPCLSSLLLGFGQNAREIILEFHSSPFDYPYLYCKLCGFVHHSVVHNLARGISFPITMTWRPFDPGLVKTVILTPVTTIPKPLARLSKIAVMCQLIK